MKKFNRREKFIIRLMLVAVVIGLAAELGERYLEHKKSLKADIAATSVQITSSLTQLQGGQTPDKYLKDAEALDGKLQRAREKIMALPNQGVASEIISSTLNQKALNAGVELTSISGRRPEEVSEESNMKELRTYFAFNTDLRELVTLMDSLEDEPYYLVLHQVNVTSRRNNLRRNRRKTNRPKKKTLNGNVLISTLFREDPEGKEAHYRQSVIGTPEGGDKAKPAGVEGLNKSDSVKADGGLRREPPMHKPLDQEEHMVKEPDETLKRAPQPLPKRRLPEDAGSANRGPAPSRTGPEPLDFKPKARPLTETSKPKQKQRRKFRP